jgi:ADP-heptose:LPS heptosyltransferase
VKSILAVRLRSIGDTVLLTPALQLLKRHWSEARLTLVVERPIQALLHGLDFVDEVVAVRPNGWLALPARLRAALSLRGRFDLAIDFHGGPTAAALVRASGAVRRVGLASYRSIGAYTDRLPAPHKGPDRSFTLHTVDANLAMLAGLGVGTGPCPPPRIGLHPSARQRADRALIAVGIDPDKPFLLLHPTAALDSKCWPLERYIQLAVHPQLKRYPIVAGFPPGGEAEREQFRVRSGRPAVGGLDLGAYAALIGRARLYVGNDSGPAHLAAAQDVPGVTLFGSQNPAVWKPVGPRQAVLWAGLDCSPCRGTACDRPVRHECLLRIHTEAVLAAILKQLGDA